MKKLIKYGLLLLVGMVSNTIIGQTIYGDWKTIDDVNGDTKSIVSLYDTKAGLEAKISKIIDDKERNALCTECHGSLKNKPILGMVLVSGLKKNDKDEFVGSSILDPEEGKRYKCKIWLNPKNSNELMVRGYIGFFYRTQTWLRVDK